MDNRKVTDKALAKGTHSIVVVCGSMVGSSVLGHWAVLSLFLATLAELALFALVLSALLVSFG